MNNFEKWFDKYYRHENPNIANEHPMGDCKIVWDMKEKKIRKLREKNKKIKEGFQLAVHRLEFAHAVMVKKSTKEIARANYLDSKKCLKELKE